MYTVEKLFYFAISDSEDLMQTTNSDKTRSREQVAARSQSERDMEGL